MNLNMKNGRIVIDGREFQGNNVSIVNGKVTVDGVVQDGELSGPVTVTVHGNVENLSNISGDVTANNVGRIKTTSGDIRCSDVGGSEGDRRAHHECDPVIVLNLDDAAVVELTPVYLGLEVDAWP